jgi:hypothetical protein
MPICEDVVYFRATQSDDRLVISAIGIPSLAYLSRISGSRSDVANPRTFRRDAMAPKR